MSGDQLHSKSVPAPELSLALAVLVGVAVRLVAPVAAVVVPVAGPQRGHAQLVVTLELVSRAVLEKNVTNTNVPD